MKPKNNTKKHLHKFLSEKLFEYAQDVFSERLGRILDHESDPSPFEYIGSDVTYKTNTISINRFLARKLSKPLSNTHALQKYLNKGIRDIGGWYSDPYGIEKWYKCVGIAVFPEESDFLLFFKDIRVRNTKFDAAYYAKPEIAVYPYLMRSMLFAGLYDEPDAIDKATMAFYEHAKLSHFEFTPSAFISDTLRHTGRENKYAKSDTDIFNTVALNILSSVTAYESRRGILVTKDYVKEFM